MRLRSVTLLLPLVAAVAPGLPAQGKIQDTIVLADGSRLRSVEVVQTGLLKIAYKKAGKDESADTGQVVEIQWGDAPEAWSQAQAAEARNDFARAAELYMEAATNGKRAPLQADAKFLAGRALLAAAGSDASRAASAGAALKAYLDENADGWHVPEARLLIARSLARQGKLPEAHAAAKEVETMAASQAWAPIWAARARVEQAEIELAQGNSNAARNTFRQAATAADAILQQGANAEATRLKMRTVVGQGEAFIGENKLDDAVTFFRGIAGKLPRNQPNETLAVAMAGEGQALYLKGVAAKNADLLRQAQTTLATASLLDPTNGNAAAKALYFSAQTLLALGPEREKDAKQRASAYLDLVAKHYPDSPWAAKARAELDKR